MFLLKKMSETDFQMNTIKFRYIVHGKPRNRRYTIEEARWCDISKRFISEQTHIMRFDVIRNWFGQSPATLGNLKTIMWIHFPPILHKYIQNQSPLCFWKFTQDAFAPYSLDQLRVWAV